ncbi:MAG TPA: type II toxin-antitoxin system RelE/ParE family toxin [Terracidiphilus sp.]|nr:type II toxin-antitoxin system RelE/ParE family toxin [Terracidiphilus sp.]
MRGTLEGHGLKRVPAIFYRTEAGNEPVRDWLKAMTQVDRKTIGEDIRTVEYGWPVGMPVCRPLGRGLHETRSSLTGNRIARIFFYVDSQQRMVLLHGIVKKTQTTPEADLKLARQNMIRHQRGLQ